MDFLRFLQTLLVITPDEQLSRQAEPITEHNPRKCDFCKEGEYYFSPTNRVHYKV